MAMVRRGTHRLLEDEADRLIRESLKGVTKHSEKSDILTPWKQQARYRREVYVASGVPDRSVRQGMFGRALNPSKPELNSRDGIAPPRYGSSTSLSDFVAEHSEDPWSD
jgi:hypothetical protein